MKIKIFYMLKNSNNNFRMKNSLKNFYIHFKINKINKIFKDFQNK